METAGTERRLARPGAVSGQYRPAECRCSGAAAARRRDEPPRDENEEEDEVEDKRRRGAEEEAAGTRGLGLPQRWRRRRPEVRSSAARSMA